MACSDSAANPWAAMAPPTIAAGVASIPKTNCLDVENSAKNRIGNTEPYSPYTAGSPAICAYPMAIGMDTAAMMIPEKISFGRYSTL